MKKTLIISLLVILSFNKLFSQNSNKMAVMEKAMIDFFTKKGEITKNEKLGVNSFEITDNSTLSAERKKGIYLIRTDSRSDGTDYLFLKNGDEFEIIGLGDLKIILKKTLILFNNESDYTLSQYIPKIMIWYNDNKASKNRREFIIIDKPKEK